MAGYRKLEDLDITRDELNQIGEALKKEEFRKLLVDYVQEVNDPENKKQFQREVTQLEKERGYDVTFINPEPGYVIKTSVDGEKKAFINVCKSDKVNRPTSVNALEKDSVGKRWSLPYTQAPPREDLDKTGKRCVVYDVVFHPETLELAGNSTQFRNMVNDTALEAVEKSFNACLDRKNMKFPKLTYKGGAFSTVIRKKSSTPPPPLDEDDPLSKLKFPFDESEEQYTTKKDVSKTTIKKETPVNITPYTTPKYTIRHRSTVDIQEFTNDRNTKLNATLPTEIIVEIDLPLLNSTSEAILDVTEKTLSLLSEKPAKYRLNITLPYTVNEDAGNAKFDKAKRKLSVTLPLKYRKAAPFSDFGRDDSGVESDLGQHTPESSSGEDESIENEVNKTSMVEEIENCENNNSVSEERENMTNFSEETRTKQLVSVLDNEVFRTNKNVNKTFLNPDLYYSFPSFSCNVVDNAVAFVLHVKNVDPNTVEKCIFEDCSGFHVKFTSIGSGFFPIHHAFCSKFPAYSSVTEDSLNIETWDNNIIVQLQLNLCDTHLGDYFAGVNEDTLVKHDLPEPTIIAQKFEELKVSAEESHFEVKVTNQSENETVIELTSVQKSDEASNATKPEEKGSESSEDNVVETNEDKKKKKHPMLVKCRTLSESSGDEMSFSPTRKGILKRVSRSLSESSVDEFTWSSSLDMIMQSGSESCIPEEDGKEIKKTVRFNEIVHEKTFRTNSSILGQRKKNQRKLRNKKRAQERRASESENSEGENEKDKGRESKTGKDEEGEEEDEEGEDDKTENAEFIEEVFETETKLQDEKVPKSTKQSGVNKSPIKGKKKIHKVGESIKEQNNTAKVELKNDLIFDLDK